MWMSQLGLIHLSFSVTEGKIYIIKANTIIQMTLLIYKLFKGPHHFISIPFGIRLLTFFSNNTPIRQHYYIAVHWQELVPLMLVLSISWHMN